MATITIEGAGPIEVETGKKLVLGIEDAGIDILHRCGGNSRCTTCRVRIIEGTPEPMGELEAERLGRDPSFGPDIRLSCQIRVTGDLTLAVVARAGETGLNAGSRPLD